MAELSFVIPGTIGGKGRGRAFVSRGKIIVRTPDKTRVDEGVVRHFAHKAMARRAPFEGALRLSVRIWQTPPASWSNKKRAETIYITGRPDIDNVLKLLADGMNRIAWRDDAQLADVRMSRKYTLEGSERIELLIETLPTDATERRS